MASNMAQELKRSLQLRKQISISQMGKKRLGFLMLNAFLCRYAIECLERPHFRPVKEVKFCRAVPGQSCQRTIQRGATAS